MEWTKPPSLGGALNDVMMNNDNTQHNHRQHWRHRLHPYREYS